FLCPDHIGCRRTGLRPHLQARRAVPTQSKIHKESDLRNVTFKKALLALILAVSIALIILVAINIRKNSSELSLKGLGINKDDFSPNEPKDNETLKSKDRKMYKPKPISGFQEWLLEERLVQQKWFDHI